MVAPLIFLVTMLTIRTGANLWVTLAATLVPAIAGLLLLVGGGRVLMRPLFHHVAAAGSTEFFMAACLLVVIGTGVITAMSGLSMGLGAFIAGLLLAETEYRREIEVTIEPFKGLLLGLFFVAIGAGPRLLAGGATPGLDGRVGRRLHRHQSRRHVPFGACDEAAVAGRDGIRADAGAGRRVRLRPRRRRDRRQDRRSCDRLQRRDRGDPVAVRGAGAGCPGAPPHAAHAQRRSAPHAGAEGRGG